MINIEKNQKIAENDNLRVYSSSGSYEDNALVEFYDEKNPDIVIGAFAAQYIKYGSLVYKFNESADLGKEILIIDPESTHTAASFVRMQNELRKQFDQGTLEPTSLQQITEDEKQAIKEEIIDQNTNINDESTVIDTTSESSVSNENPSQDNSLGSGNTETQSTSENSLSEPIPDNTSSSTPEVVLPENSDSNQESLPVDLEQNDVEQSATSTEPVNENVSSMAPSMNHYARKKVRNNTV